MNKTQLKKKFNFLDSSEYSFEKVIDQHCIDWRGDFIGNSNMIIFPKSVDVISKIIIACEESHTNCASGRKHRIGWWVCSAKK